MPVQQPLVSVLMPVYNGEKYLAEAITSILDQTFRDFEFLIINDGSTDRTEEIILSFADDRVRYVKNESNLKIIATLNKGLSLANGKYIARMDADDISLPNRLQVQVEFMEKNESYGLCGSDIQVMDERNQNTQSWIKTGDDAYLKFCLLFQNPICHPTVVIRKSVIDKYQLSFRREYIHAEEYALWIEMARHSKLMNLKEPLLKYRMHEGQVSTIFQKIQQETVSKINWELFSDLMVFPFISGRNLQLALTDQLYFRSVPTADDILGKFNRVKFFEKGLGQRMQLWIWLHLIRFSLRFRKEWNNVYIQSWISEIKKVASTKSRLFRL